MPTASHINYCAHVPEDYVKDIKKKLHLQCPVSEQPEYDDKDGDNNWDDREFIGEVMWEWGARYFWHSDDGLFCGSIYDPDSRDHIIVDLGRTKRVYLQRMAHFRMMYNLDECDCCITFL